MALLATRFGSTNKLAIAVNLSYALVLRLKEGEEMTADQAERIERQLNLPNGWMSVAHPEGLQGVGRIDELAGIPEDNSAAMQATRRANTDLLIGDGHGAKAQFAKAMKWHATEVQHLEKRTFGYRKARAMEAQLGLPAGWLDSPHAPEQVPPEVRALIDGKGDEPRAGGSSSLPNLVAAVSSMTPSAGGPIARALLQTVITQINEGVLSEKRAHELLGKLLEADE